MLTILNQHHRNPVGPINHCCYIVPGKLLAGDYPRDRQEHTSRLKIDAIVKSGVKAFIDLTEEHEGLLPYVHLLGERAIHTRFPI